MQVATLTDRQRSERDHFNKHGRDLSHIDFNYYSRPEFGPWNPYWFVYNLVRESYRGPTQRLLSFGCGRGRDALRYAHIGYNVCGFDISSTCIQNAKALAQKYRLTDRAHLSVQTAEALSYTANTFDIVVGENILHHVNIQDAMREVSRVLKPGGFAVFKEPMATPARDWFRKRPPIRWIIPIGVKNFPLKVSYDPPRGTVIKLTEAHFEAMRRMFSEVTVVHFRFLAVLSMFMRRRTFFERCDQLLFRVLPPLRQFGDMVVIIVKKH